MPLWQSETATTRRSLNEYDTIVYIRDTLGPLYAAEAKRKQYEGKNQYSERVSQESDEPSTPLCTDDRLAQAASGLLGKPVSRDKTLPKKFSTHLIKFRTRTGPIRATTLFFVLRRLPFADEVSRGRPNPS